jgi:hypothetical protein
MRRLIVSLALTAAFAAGPVTAQTVPQTAPPAPLQVPAPPARGGPTNTLLIDALRAIARAQVSNPTAANAAEIPYAQGISRFWALDRAGARADAVQAISVANEPALTPDLPALTLVLPNPPAAWFSGTDTPLMDAQAFVGLASDALTHCSATGAALTAAQTSFAAAQQALAAGNNPLTRAKAQATISAC